MPCNIHEREVAHIFRPFTGYLECRLIPIGRKMGSDAKTHNVFVDFDTREQAAHALGTLQGYKVDLKDPSMGAIRLEFAKTAHKRELK